jgi:hypothetical protein
LLKSSALVPRAILPDNFIRLSVALQFDNSALMRLRHAVALALVGWYLMVPPPCLDPDEPAPVCRNIDAGLENWRIRGSFDAAKDCRTDLEQWKQRSHASKETVLPSQPIKQSKKTWWAGLSQAQQQAAIEEMDAYSAACIATDDPRLKEK